jgi:hypothetical protein
VAISVAWQTTATVSATTNTFYTVPASTSATFAYARDLVINNSGANTLFVTMTPASATCLSASSFAIPAGGTLLLTQCQVTAGNVVGVGCTGTLSTSVSLGYATNVAYI